MVPPATGKWHDPIQPLPFDLAKANQLLDQAGYKMGPGGVRTANGHPMKYQVDFSSDQNGPGDRLFQIIQADYKKIGVQLTQRVLDPSAEFNAITANKYRNYNLAMWYWVPIADPTSSFPCTPAASGTRGTTAGTATRRTTGSTSSKPSPPTRRSACRSSTGCRR